MNHAKFYTHQDYDFSMTWSRLDVNGTDHNSNVSTYSEYTGEISSSSFPHFECIIIDSCDYMLIPQIPANLTQQKTSLRQVHVHCILQMIHFLHAKNSSQLLMFTGRELSLFHSILYTYLKIILDTLYFHD